jgi:hypothetical protein
MNSIARKYETAGDESEIRKDIATQIKMQLTTFQEFIIPLGHQAMIKSLIIFLKGKKVILLFFFQFVFFF